MNDRIVFRIVAVLTAVVLVAVVALRFIERPGELPAFAKLLPGLNACLNGTCALLLAGSFLAIKSGRVAVHKRLNLGAFALSVVFLLSYVTYHAVAPETKFPAGHPWRPVYLVILFSHILTAALVLPLVLLSFYRGLMNQVELHRRIVRWSFPVWLYVTVTGVVVYFMIRPYYPF